VARAYRDAKVFQIVEGTNEIHRTLIARELAKQASAPVPSRPAAALAGDS
jgi:alkylation response protein AidB-like acyl-CoA dehydrogenase